MLHLQEKDTSRFIPDNQRRRRSEEYYDRFALLDSSSPRIDDKWLYEWTDRPPDAFIRHKTIFRQYTPGDIAGNGWVVLNPAVKELASAFGIRVPECKPFNKKEEAARKLTNLREWLVMNDYCSRPCILGIHGGEYVTAAAKVTRHRATFVPFNLYSVLKKNDSWKHLRFRASYRHFQARFDIGYAFYTERNHKLCTVSYGIDAGVHGKNYLWAMIKMDGVLFPSPYCIGLPADLSGLSGIVEQVNSLCMKFVRELGIRWLQEYDSFQIFRLICKRVEDTVFPSYALNSLQNAPQLSQCRTQLDILETVMRAMNVQDDGQIPHLINLSKRFLINKEFSYDTI